MQPQTISESQKFSPFFLFFLVQSMQIGTGLLGFQKFVAIYAGYDGWQSVLFAGLTMNIIMWFVFKQLEMVNGDLCDIHWTVFGKPIGNLFNIFIALYYVWYALTVLRNYIEIVQVWMFPDLSTFWFAISYLVLCVYIIYGGFRTIVGISFFSFILPFYIIFVQGFTLPFSDFHHFLPVFDHSINDVVNAAQQMSLANSGFETLLIYYPFLKNPKKAKKYGQISLLFTTLMYLFTTLITFAYFAQTELKREIWPTLTAYKIVKLPVVERFEYIGIANWCLTILPSSCITLWCAGRLLKRTTKIKMKYGVLLYGALILLGCIAIKTRAEIDILNALTNDFGFFMGYIYIPLLFVLLWLAIKIKSKKKA
ncbi:GerAB/ArcD/ProY family transporter [Bacillus sp. FJAT-49736]|uniref:GerAB/ArcD/ProY family transporter n=1 Tax=Bacillus sp. FJAT-49736 TaxID=2833582 RepID=UPI001BC9D41C|nr:GerAB/ArcD/ProY family transporter [Bacillus sp. FJAT-49736]MBS4174365.1 GerAB/ArcD/ProY family transporter [Bacillus sp. FJAT-49736]